MDTPAIKSDATPAHSSPAGTWILFFLVLFSIGAVGYFAFYDTGSGRGRPTNPVVSATTRTRLSSPVGVLPSPLPSVSTTPGSEKPANAVE